jgi:membrane-associated protein
VAAAFSWGILLPWAGVFLGGFEWVGHNIDLIIILIVLASITPMVVEYLRHRSARRRQAAAKGAWEDLANPPDAVATSTSTDAPAASGEPE